MKRLTLLLLAALLLLCACGAPTVLEKDPETALVTLDGDTLMTVRDFSRLMTEQQVSHDVKGTALKSEKDLFVAAAEERILAALAELYGVAADRAALEEEFDHHMEEIRDTSVYGKEYELAQELQKALDMDEDAYRDWTVQQTYFEFSAEALLADIAGEYRFLADPGEMEEAILRNLEFMTQIYDARVYYPGLAEEKRSFTTAL